VILQAGRRTLGAGSRRGSGMVTIRFNATGRRLLARSRRALLVRALATATYPGSPALRTSTVARLR